MFFAKVSAYPNDFANFFKFLRNFPPVFRIIQVAPESWSTFRMENFHENFTKTENFRENENFRKLFCAKSEKKFHEKISWSTDWIFKSITGT
jgi:hypothetical protein